MVSRHFRPLLLACTALVAIAPGFSASAQDASTTSTDAAGTQLQTIVVKGKRAATGVAAGSRQVTETTAEEIREKEIDSITDLGNTTEPGVDFVQPRLGATGGLFIRGLGGPRVVTLIDNIPVPFLQNSARVGTSTPTTSISDSSNSFDFSSLSSVDVLRGADSSRIGSGALAGALILRTLEPEDLIKDGRDWGAVAKTSYDSEDRSVGGSLAIAKKIENTSILFQGSYKKGHERDNKGDNSSYGVNRTKPNPTDVEQNNLLFKIRQDIEGGHRIGLTAERFDVTNDLNLKTLQGTTSTAYKPDGYWGYDDTRRERVSLDYNFEAPDTESLIDAAMLTAYWQRLSKGAGSYGTRNSGAAYERHNEMEERSFGVTGSALSEFQTGNLSHEVRFGGNVDFFQSEQFLTAIPTTTVSQSDLPDVDGTRLGVYLEDRISIGDTGLAITPGIRFDWYNYRPSSSEAFLDNTGYSYFGLPDDKSGSRFSPKLLATYQLTPELELYAQWSMAYRAPTVSELYGNFTNVAGGYTALGNPDLKAETANGFEIGANYETADLAGRVSVYHNRYKNFINATEEYTTAFPAGYFPSFMINSWENLDRVEITGFEANARKEFDNGIVLHGSIALAYGEDKETGEYIRSIAPVKSILGVGYQKETWGVDLSTILQAGMRDDDNARTFDAPGYGVVNLTGYWEPEQIKGLRIQAGVFNLFDKTYWNPVGVEAVNPLTASTANQPVAFYSEPGRTFKLSITKQF